MKNWKKIGEILLEQSAITPDMLADSLRQQADSKQRLGEILLDNAYITEITLYRALARQWNLSFEEKLNLNDIDCSLLESFPLEHLRKIQSFAFFKNDEQVWVATVDPFRDGLIEELSAFFKKKLFFVISVPSQIHHVLNELYGRAQDSDEIIETIAIDETVEGTIENYQPEDVLESANKAPIVRFVNTLIFQSLRERASDIHLELSPDGFKIRYRIDGVLVNRFSPPRKLHAPVTSRIKIMAALDIAERRLPQDGKIRVRFGDREVDIRVSTVPCSYGERIVMRLLDRHTELLTLEQMGMSDSILQKFDSLIHRPNGILLVTGPTGSGKTTTLYGAIMRTASADVNVITLEDPVEYELPGVSQIPVKPRIGFTFASGLRSILRQDPDVILVGEIRDPETATMAIQASLTGHLVFSTLHTNDAASAAVRLVDMNVEPYLVASTLIGVLAQRLVRKLCTSCKTNTGEAWEARGCDNCADTGYKGRCGVFELLTIEKKLSAMIAAGASLDEIRAYAKTLGVKTLYEDGIEKVRQGVTTFTEVERVCYHG